MSTLPRIMRFFEPTATENSQCPHCGATGKVIHRFQTEDGRQLGAMSGCVKLFPIHPVAQEDLLLRKKEIDASRKRQRLASWDIDRRAAIDAFYSGTTDEATTMHLLRSATSRAKAYVARRGRR